MTMTMVIMTTIMMVMIVDVPLCFRRYLFSNAVTVLAGGVFGKLTNVIFL